MQRRNVPCRSKQCAVTFLRNPCHSCASQGGQVFLRVRCCWIVLHALAYDSMMPCVRAHSLVNETTRSRKVRPPRKGRGNVDETAVHARLWGQPSAAAPAPTQGPAVSSVKVSSSWLTTLGSARYNSRGTPIGSSSAADGSRACVRLCPARYYYDYSRRGRGKRPPLVFPYRGGAAESGQVASRWASCY